MNEDTHLLVELASSEKKGGEDRFDLQNYGVPGGPALPSMGLPQTFVGTQNLSVRSFVENDIRTVDE